MNCNATPLILTTCILTFIWFTTQAQQLTPQGKLEGQVITATQKPVEYATVSLLKARDSLLIKSTLTDEKGKYILLKVPAGSYLIAVEWLGSPKLIKGPYLLKEAQELLSIPAFTLTNESKELQTVTVSGKKPLIERRDGKVILNVANSTLATGNTAMEILSRAPGVTVDNEGNLSLKGKGGVNVMIDGKLTYLSSSQLANLLRNTDGNSIQSIELMSTPSAKYDATGTGGIINIKLKKNTAYGTNGTLTAGGGYGKYYKSNAGLTFNHRAKNINVFGSYNYVNSKDQENLTINRSNTAGLEKTYFDQQTINNNKRQNHNYKAGIDYYLNEKNSIGFIFSGYDNTGHVNTQNTTLIGSQPGRTDSAVLATNPGLSKYRNQSYNLNYKGTLDTSGQELTFDADYSQFRSTNEISYNNYFYNAAGGSSQPPLFFRNAAPSKIRIWSGKLDYTYPFNPKTKLETGLKSSYVSTDNDFQWENLQQHSWQNDPARSNRFNYKENINAAYANLNKEFKSTTVQLGLRGELTNSEGNSLTLQNKVNRTYFDLFPSLSVSQRLSDAHDLGFSYSRRIDRPDYQSLNPFLFFADLYTYNQGNPYLNPQYANSFELTYGYKKTLNITFGYIHTKNVITTILVTDTVKKTLLVTEQNLAARNTYSMNVSRPFAITSWWNTSNDATLYYSRFSTPNLMGLPFKSGKLTYLLNTTQTLTISPSISAEASASYSSSQVYGTYIAKPIYGVDLGISKSFAGQKANIKLAVNDLFNTRKIDVSSAVALQNYRLNQKEETRIFRATFTYNFGSTLIKAVRSRSNSADAEKSRIKSGN